MKKESVLCIPTEEAKRLELCHTVKRSGVIEKIEESNYLLQFKSRCEIEDDPNILQLLPYVLCTNPDRTKILAYQRKGGSEGRLEGLWSIGVGGHINLRDVYIDNDLGINATQTIESGLSRELLEELDLFGDIKEASFLGTIFLTNTSVNSVHLGLVFHQELLEEQLLCESSHLKPVWLSPEELATKKLEDWSKELVRLFL